MVTTQAFHACCTGRILYDFGESFTAEYGSTIPDADTVKKRILSEIASWKRSGYAFLSAVTNNEQKVANKVLRELGFVPSKWMTKRNHPNTKVRIWYYHLRS